MNATTREVIADFKTRVDALETEVRRGLQEPLLPSLLTVFEGVSVVFRMFVSRFSCACCVAWFYCRLFLKHAAFEVSRVFLPRKSEASGQSCAP